MSNEALQAEDQAAARHAVAPRVTLKSMEDRMARVHYFTAGQALDAINDTVPAPCPEHLLTICIIVMQNGYTVVGLSACASPENFNREFGQELAYKDAVGKLWGLEAYLLREQLQYSAATGDALDTESGDLDLGEPEAPDDDPAPIV